LAIKKLSVKAIGSFSIYKELLSLIREEKKNLRIKSRIYLTK
jgi:hypothetical protein